jgi:hypothetical protein
LPLSRQADKSPRGTGHRGPGFSLVRLGRVVYGLILQIELETLI